MSFTECTNINKSYSSTRPQIMTYYIAGLPVNDMMVYFIIEFDDDLLKFKQVELKTFGKNDIKRTFQIPNSRVIAVDVLTEKKIKEKQKSVISRGLVGGLVFGPAGLILGGLSGTGVKTTAKDIHALCFSYYKENSEEIQNIVFAVDPFLEVCAQFALDYTTKFINPVVKYNPEDKVVTL